MRLSEFDLNDIHKLANMEDTQPLSFPERKEEQAYTKNWRYRGRGEFSTRIIGIKINKHAYLRWNERISVLPSNTELYNLLSYIFIYESDRVERHHVKILNDVTFNYFIIDNDIIGTHSYDDEGQIRIETFLGRLKLKYQLQDISSLYKFNAIEKDHTDLKVEPEVLKKQLTPFGPSLGNFIEKTNTWYYLFEFTNERIVLKISPKSDTGQLEYQTLVLRHAYNTLSLTDLSAILLMGNKKFVAKHIATNYKDMPELTEHISNKALRKFKQKVIFNNGRY